VAVKRIPLAVAHIYAAVMPTSISIVGIAAVLRRILRGAPLRFCDASER
jgi:hypothetical protein